MRKNVTIIGPSLFSAAQDEEYRAQRQVGNRCMYLGTPAERLVKKYAQTTYQWNRALRTLETYLFHEIEMCDAVVVLDSEPLDSWSIRALCFAANCQKEICWKADRMMYCTRCRTNGPSSRHFFHQAKSPRTFNHHIIKRLAYEGTIRKNDAPKWMRFLRHYPLVQIHGWYASTFLFPTGVPAWVVNFPDQASGPTRSIYWAFTFGRFKKTYLQANGLPWEVGDQQRFIHLGSILPDGFEHAIGYTGVARWMAVYETFPSSCFWTDGHQSAPGDVSVFRSFVAGEEIRTIFEGSFGDYLDQFRASMWGLQPHFLFDLAQRSVYLVYPDESDAMLQRQYQNPFEDVFPELEDSGSLVHLA